MNSLRGTIWNFGYLNGSSISHLLMYDIPLDVAEECLLDKAPYISNNDFLRSLLINEGVSESMISYYELSRDNDLLAWAGSSFTSKTSVGG